MIKSKIGGGVSINKKLLFNKNRALNHRRVIYMYTVILFHLIYVRVYG